MIKLQDIPIIVIHLQSRVDRFLWITQHLLDNKFPPYKIFAATNDEDGVVGLLYTMTSVMKGLMDSDYPYVLVMEDDAEVITTLPERKINAALADLNGDFDLLYLGCNLERPDSKKHTDNTIKIFTAKAAHAIIYSRPGIQKTLERLLAMDSPIPYDELLIDVQRDSNSFATSKLIFGQIAGHSDIQKKSVNYNNMLKTRFKKNAPK